MKVYCWFVVCLSLGLPIAVSAADPLQLRYTRPAERWTEALPAGNGGLGAMVFGGVTNEQLQLNEASLWSGAPRNWNNPAAREILPQVRAAIFAGDYVKSGELSKKMQGPYNQSYQPLGNLKLTFPGTESFTAYERSLDLDRAVATVRYRIGDAVFTREVFSSYPDQVIVIRITCNKPGRINFSAMADSLLRHNVQTEKTDTLILRGRAPACRPELLEYQQSNPV